MFFSNYTILKLDLFPCPQIQFLCTSIPNSLGKAWTQLQVPTAQQDTQKLLSPIAALLFNLLNWKTTPQHVKTGCLVWSCISALFSSAAAPLLSAFQWYCINRYPQVPLLCSGGDWGYSLRFSTACGSQKDLERTGSEWGHSLLQFILLLWPHSPLVLFPYGFLHQQDGNDSWHLFPWLHCTPCSLQGPPTAPLCCPWVPFSMLHVGVPILHSCATKNDSSDASSANPCFALTLAQPSGGIATTGILQVLWKLWNSPKVRQNREHSVQPQSWMSPANCSLQTHRHHVQRRLQTRAELPAL